MKGISFRVESKVYRICFELERNKCTRETFWTVESNGQYEYVNLVFKVKPHLMLKTSNFIADYLVVTDVLNAIIDPSCYFLSLSKIIKRNVNVQD